MSQANNAAVETLLANIGSTHGELLEIVQQVRRVATASGSGVTESVKYGGIMFSHTQFFCGVSPTAVTSRWNSAKGTDWKIAISNLKATANIGGTSSSTRSPR